MADLPSYGALLRYFAAACDALDYAHAEGFEWPIDPFGDAALAFADVEGAVERLAQGTEAQRAETGTGSVHDGPVGETDAPTPTPEHS
jgi:hypothetical protein